MHSDLLVRTNTDRDLDLLALLTSGSLSNLLVELIVVEAEGRAVGYQHLLRHEHSTHALHVEGSLAVACHLLDLLAKGVAG